MFSIEADSTSHVSLVVYLAAKFNAILTVINYSTLYDTLSILWTSLVHNKYRVNNRAKQGLMQHNV